MPRLQLGSTEIKSLKLDSKQNVDLMLIEEGWGTHGGVETIYRRD